MNKTHQQALDQRQMYVKEIGRIEGLPQTQRWRAIKNFLLKVKPELRHIDNQFINAIKEERESTLLETGATKSGSTRKLYSMPQYLYAALHLLDPEFTKLQDDPESSKAINLKIAKTFPEYAIARKI
jgi:hypothetical protein